MNLKYKLKDLKYQAEGIESPRPGMELLVPLVFIFGIVPIFMILIGLVLMYANRIDSIPPSWQLFFAVVGLGYPVYLGIKRVWVKMVLKK